MLKKIMLLIGIGASLLILPSAAAARHGPGPGFRGHHPMGHHFMPRHFRGGHRFIGGHRFGRGFSHPGFFVPGHGRFFTGHPFGFRHHVPPGFFFQPGFGHQVFVPGPGFVAVGGGFGGGFGAGGNVVIIHRGCC